MNKYLLAASSLALAMHAAAQTTPPAGKWTVLVHGRTGSCSYPANYNGLIAESGSGNWMRQLAARIESLSPGNVNTYRVDSTTLGLVTVNAGGTNPLDPTRHHVVMFDWGATSDFDPVLCQAPSGNQNGFAFAAGDSLVSLLKQWNASGSVFSLVGYSRGAIVVSEAARRLMVAGTNPAQVVFIDGEGCEAGGSNGCTFYSDGRFDAWAPPSGAVRFDNLYELVNEHYLAPAVCATDLGGHAKPRCGNLNLGTTFAHTTWGLTSSCFPSYSQSAIHAYLIGGLIVTGGRYSYPGSVGSIQDPNPPAAGSDPITLPFNGNFTYASLAGWMGNGGGGTGTISSLASTTTLRLARGQSQAHNFISLPPCSTTLRFAAAVEGASSGDSALTIVLKSSGVADVQLDSIPLAQLSTSFGKPRQYPIPLTMIGRVSVIQFAVSGTTGTAAAHVTGVTIPPCQGVCYADCDGAGGLTANDFQCFLDRFVAGESYANCDGVGGLTANDFQCFLNAFVAGCS